MKLSTMFVINAVVAFLFGLGFVLAPGTLLSMYGVALNDTALYLARLLGSAFIGFAIISWLVKNSTGSSELRAIALAFCIGDLLGFVFSLYYQLQGLSNSLGWSTVVIYLFLGLGFGYFYLRKPDAA